jgi:hypothetical protein
VKCHGYLDLLEVALDSACLQSMQASLQGLAVGPQSADHAPRGHRIPRVAPAVQLCLKCSSFSCMFTDTQPADADVGEVHLRILGGPIVFGLKDHLSFERIEVGLLMLCARAHARLLKQMPLLDGLNATSRSLHIGGL